MEKDAEETTISSKKQVYGSSLYILWLNYEDINKFLLQKMQ
jgi:hypothetical protein